MKPIIEKVIQTYGKLALTVVLTLVIALTVTAQGAATPEAHGTYDKKVEAEIDAYNAYLFAKKERCLAEKELATAKVLDYLNKERSLENGEVLEKLVNKTKWSCNDSLPQSDGNFTPTTSGGLEQFLQVNGASQVKEAADIFIAVGEKHNVKPEVLVCIAQADSSLGKHLRTANNIGNVGNTATASRSYPTLEAGIEAMGIVLNNQYLGHHQTMGDLSVGGGNTTGKVYATSPYNWNKNTLACLRNIYQDPTIDESFNFRANE
jgi:hypothetical protein